MPLPWAADARHIAVGLGVTAVVRAECTYPAQYYGK